MNIDLNNLKLDGLLKQTNNSNNSNNTNTNTNNNSNNNTNSNSNSNSNSNNAEKSKVKIKSKAKLSNKLTSIKESNKESSKESNKEVNNNNLRDLQFLANKELYNKYYANNKSDKIVIEEFDNYKIQVRDKINELYTYIIKNDNIYSLLNNNETYEFNNYFLLFIKSYIVYLKNKKVSNEIQEEFLYYSNNKTLNNNSSTISYNNSTSYEFFNKETHLNVNNVNNINNNNNNNKSNLDKIIEIKNAKQIKKILPKKR